jgi:Reverse transcriptase (RNA-dependent DNA polymerase)
MYSRDAKGIDQGTWKDLMRSCTDPELLQTILESGKQKAAGYDGVNSDLVRMLVEDSKEQAPPLLSLLLSLINVSFESGSTLTSWRKAIVSMIPKRKEDGSLTSLIGEMRPISVLQEFGKIASKILANRMGEILLKQPGLMTRAQRAFLKDGSTTQCLNTALNILEDFQVKRKKNKKSQLFMLAYDQVKAYDCVQAYTIRVSLERFNLPERFIDYVLSNLVDATSCFKTFYGPTEEVAVEASVRQGDPLSPLIYICITDPLHEGLRSNPLYGNCKTGYRFSNDPSSGICR